MIGFLATKLGLTVGVLKIGLIVAGIGAIIGAYAWLTTAAYNRGWEASERRAAAVIAEQRKRREEDLTKTQKMTQKEVDEWFIKKCIEAGGSPEACR